MVSLCYLWCSIYLSTMWSCVVSWCIFLLSRTLWSGVAATAAQYLKKTSTCIQTKPIRFLRRVRYVAVCRLLNKTHFWLDCFRELHWKRLQAQNCKTTRKTRKSKVVKAFLFISTYSYLFLLISTFRLFISYLKLFIPSFYVKHFRNAFEFNK